VPSRQGERDLVQRPRLGGGSIVAYVLEIALVDPLQHDLLFERFLNPGRISMPDIDLDFRDDRRAEMLEYCVHKYGDDKVAQIITFGTMGTKAALRDVARVMDIRSLKWTGWQSWSRSFRAAIPRWKMRWRP
jgi:DNA polymerase III alpha subunit